MGLKEKVDEDLKNALKSGEATRVSVLRMLSAAIHNKEIEKRTKLAKEGKSPEPLAEEEVLAALSSEAKKRRESVESFEKVGRHDLAAKEKEELAILNQYLPAQLSEEAVSSAVAEAIAATAASGPKDAGKVLGYLSAKLKGRADMAAVAKMVAGRLQNPAA